MASDTRDGTVSWVDLSTPDIEAARRFYADLFGWTLATQHTDMGDYTVASADGREVAGMMAQGPELAGQPAMWTTFVVVDDLEATLGRVTEAGGAVHQQPLDIPGGARVAVITDSSGAMLALISGGPPPGPYLSETVGAIGWVELMTRRPEAAEDFYRATFGWEAERSDPAESGGVAYTVFRRGDEHVAGMIATPDHVPPEVPDTWSMYVMVADCRATERRAVELGGSVLLETMPTPMGPFAVLADPAGDAFQVMEMATAEAPA